MYVSNISFSNDSYQINVTFVKPYFAMCNCFQGKTGYSRKSIERRSFVSGSRAISEIDELWLQGAIWIEPWLSVGAVD